MLRDATALCRRKRGNRAGQWSDCSEGGGIGSVNEQSGPFAPRWREWAVAVFCRWRSGR